MAEAKVLSLWQPGGKESGEESKKTFEVSTLLQPGLTSLQSASEPTNG